MTTVLERLAKNDPTLTKLKLVQVPEHYYDDPDDENAETCWGRLLETIRHNTTVTYVLLERHFVRSLSLDQWVAVLKAIGQMQALEEIEIWSVRVPLKELCEALQSSPKLARLGLGFVTLLGDLNAEALRGHPTLKNVYLSDFRLSEVGASLNSLFEALSECPQMEYIELFQYQQEETPFTGVGLAKLLQSESLQHLTLRRMGLTALVVSELAQNLVDGNRHSNHHRLRRHKSHLRVLNLNENLLGDTGCAALGEALEHNHELLELNLRKNQITPTGCLQLAHSLTQNIRLEKLNLACNPMEDVGARALAVVLQLHPTLKTLELHRTHLTDLGCRYLAEALKHNTALVNLDVSFNDITEAAYVDVAEALKVNHTLKNINIQVNKKMKLQACEALLSMVKENYALESVSTLMRVRFEPSKYHQFEDLLHQMNTYLRLNHAGRERLLRGDATPQEWASSLLAMHDDLNGLYYLMQANPALCCHMMTRVGVLDRKNVATPVVVDSLATPQVSSIDTSTMAIIPNCLPIVR